MTDNSYGFYCVVPSSNSGISTQIINFTQTVNYFRATIVDETRALYYANYDTESTSTPETWELWY